MVSFQAYQDGMKVVCVLNQGCIDFLNGTIFKNTNKGKTVTNVPPIHTFTFNANKIDIKLSNVFKMKISFQCEFINESILIHAPVTEQSIAQI